MYVMLALFLVIVFALYGTARVGEGFQAPAFIESTKQKFQQQVNEINVMSGQPMAYKNHLYELLAINIARTFLETQGNIIIDNVLTQLDEVIASINETLVESDAEAITRMATQYDFSAPTEFLSVLLSEEAGYYTKQLRATTRN